MKRFASLALALLAALASTGAQAVDIFDVRTNLLTLQSVSVAGQNYYNASVTVGGYSQLSVAGGPPVAESFDPGTNMLTMGTVVAAGQTYNNVRVHIDSYTLNAAGKTATAVGNSVPITVDSGPTNNSVNVPFVSVTVCQPGNQAQCQVIDHLLLDTGSTGLRVLSTVLSSSINLPSVSSPSGLPLLNCGQYLDNSFTWGPVVSADVSLGGNSVASLPIQVVGSPQYSALSGTCATGNANDTVAKLGAKGILGIGLFQQDCGAGCAKVLKNGIYFTCSTAACTSAVATTAGQAQQLQNLAGLLSHDNNGVVIDLPPVGATGAHTVTGALYLGIGTQVNNGLASASVQTTDANGYITTSIENRNLKTSFIDTGSNGLYFDTPSLSKCTGSGSSSFSSFYCPAASTPFTIINVGANGAQSFVSFAVDNASTQFNNLANTAFPQLGGTVNDSQTFDWGLPFFFGRRVFIGLEGKNTGAVTGPFYAY